MNSVHFLTSQSKRNTVDFFSLENQTELQEMRAPLSNLQEQLREKDDKLREKEGINLSLQARLNTKNKQLEEKIRQEENLYQKLGAVEEQISQSQAQLREKELEKAKLLKERDRLNGNLRAMHQQLTNSRFSELLKTKMQEQLERKEQQLVESELRLRELNQQLRDLQVQIREKDRATVALQERLGITAQQVGELEEQLTRKDREKNELERSLSTAQQILRDNQAQRSPDWVIPRNQIQLTTKSLGRGAWGEVVQGRFCGCVVAVKTIHDLILSPHNRRLFEREMDIASRCRHPCLLQFIGATNDDHTPLFLTEVMETSLRALLQERSLSQTEITVIALDVARGLNYLHQKRPIPILHRDISSANVLLWRQGTQWRAKVSDYGTANFKKQTMTVAPGTPIYSAPEAHATNQTVQVSSD